MGYVYEIERPYVFTEDGQIQLFAVIRKARACVEDAGAVRHDKLTGAADCPDNWKANALVDRLVELKMLREIDQGRVAGQDRIFVEGAVSL